MKSTGRTRWTDAKLEEAIRGIASELGHFPSNAELSEMGRLDVANRITRSGGFRHWASLTGIPHVSSDSNTGWAGEDAAAHRLEALGFTVTAREGVKCPYDLLVDGVLRIDVKAASYQEYGRTKGWFFRIGKQPQADMIMLWQLDKGIFYAIPWYLCPFTNVTISRSGGKYVAFQDNVDVIRKMVFVRRREQEQMKPSVLMAADHSGARQQ